MAIRRRIDGLAKLIYACVGPAAILGTALLLASTPRGHATDDSAAVAPVVEPVRVDPAVVKIDPPRRGTGVRHQ